VLDERLICEGSGQFVPLDSWSVAVCPMCDHFEPAPADVAERDGQRVGRLPRHERAARTLHGGTLAELLAQDAKKDRTQ
jgi:hypothetical protein